MSPNIQINWIKDSKEQKLYTNLGEEEQDYQDGSGLQFIKFHFVTRCQEIRSSIPVKF